MNIWNIYHNNFNWITQATNILGQDYTNDRRAESLCFELWKEAWAPEAKLVERCCITSYAIGMKWYNVVSG